MTLHAVTLAAEEAVDLTDAPNSQLILAAILGIAAVVLLTTLAKFHPFLATAGRHRRRLLPGRLDGRTRGRGRQVRHGRQAHVEVTVSAPYFKGDYVPVDDAGNFRADQWVVRGYNNSDHPVDVRAWVVCAPLAG